FYTPDAAAVLRQAGGAVIDNSWKAEVGTRLYAMIKWTTHLSKGRCIHAINLSILQVAHIKITRSTACTAETNIAQARPVDAAVGQTAGSARTRGAVQPINT